MSSKPIYEFGSFRLDPAEHLLLRAGKPVALTPKAFDTLVVLVEESGHLVRKDELMKRVWPDAFVEEVNLAQNVSAIRRVLDTNGEQYIETVPKVGYRLNVKARVVGEPEILPVGVAAGAESGTQAQAATPRIAKPARGRVVRLVAVLTVLVLAALAWWLSQRSRMARAAS